MKRLFRCEKGQTAADLVPRIQAEGPEGKKNPPLISGSGCCALARVRKVGGFESLGPGLIFIF